MTTYSKPAVRHAWAETASVSDITDPGDTLASAGWAQGVKPPRQYFNWVMNYTFTAVRYFCQQGMAQWDAQETYPIYGMARSGGGTMYVSKQNNNVNQPLGVNAWWDVPYVDTAPAGDNTVRIANTAWVQGFALKIGSAFSAIAGSIGAGQVPVGAVTQWQGSLSIAGSQVSSAVARANSLFLTSGSYATFNWSGQSGQPAWLFGSNDGQNVFVWNPSNFSVNNSVHLGGLLPNAAAAANTVVIRDPSGYIYGQYLNQGSSNNENPSIGQVMVTNGSDGFLRKAAIGYLGDVLNPTTIGSQVSSTLPGGLIIKAGSVSGVPVSGQPVDVAISFSQAFPTACVGVWPCTDRSVAVNGQAVDGSNYSSNRTRSGATLTIDSGSATWFAIGY